MPNALCFENYITFLWYFLALTASFIKKMLSCFNQVDCITILKNSLGNIIILKNDKSYLHLLLIAMPTDIYYFINQLGYRVKFRKINYNK